MTDEQKINKIAEILNNYDADDMSDQTMGLHALIADIVDGIEQEDDE